MGTDLKSVRSRWMERRNRKQEAPDYQDRWRVEQCLHCRFYTPLIGELGGDFGACSNPTSPFDGRVMFEHDGCEHHQHVDN